MYENCVFQTVFAKDVLTMFRCHDDLLLACFKKWEELCCMAQVVPGLAVSRGEMFTGGLLNTQAKEIEAACDNNG